MNIGFIIDKTFHHKHIGVKNYCLALAKILEPFHTITFLYYEHTDPVLTIHFRLGQWHALTPIQHDSPTETNASPEIVYEGSPKQVLNQFLTHKNFSATPKNPTVQKLFHQQALGNTLENTHLDLLLLTAPWLPVEGLQNCSIPVYSIIYDSIPNSQTFTKSDFSIFASLHQRGFEWSVKNAQGLWFISEYSQQEFLRYFPHCPATKTAVLPPLLPQSYFALLAQVTNTHATWEDKEPALVLAAPFDARKGLTFIPSLLTNVAHNLETLYIYGNQRCSTALIRTFLETLPVKHMVWVQNAHIETVHQFFQKSRGLLFPSIEEGLGLPIIEAQLMGTKVLTLDKPPMNTLQLPEWKTVLTEKASSTWDNYITQWFNAPYNPQLLKQQAIDNFIQPLSQPEFLSKHLQKTQN